MNRIKNKKRAAVLAVCALLILAAVLLLRFRVSSAWLAVSGDGWTDVNSTGYLKLGDSLLKYSPDGAEGLDVSGKVRWSVTYSMATPLADACGGTAAVAEQQGTQVLFFDEDGQTGQFETTLPIRAVRVAEQGVAAVVLEDDDVTWINFYQSDGTLIAENRTTLGDSGYPLDMDLAPDGLQIMVSYLQPSEGSLNTRVAFYSFDSVGQAEINNLVGSFDYENTVIPLTFFVSRNTSVAVQSYGFSVYSGRTAPKERVAKTFEEEALSVFHDDSYVGFLFSSDREDARYKIQLYNMNGRMVMQRYIDYAYTGISVQDGHVVVWNEKKFEVFGPGGRRKVSVTYNSGIENVLRLGTGRYLVAASDATEVIRVY